MRVDRRYFLAYAGSTAPATGVSFVTAEVGSK
jgi:hypothetical protein